MTPTTAFVIVNYNGGPRLAETLHSIAVQTCQAFEAIVVDNGSTDESCPASLFTDPRFHRISLPDNRGFAEGSNIGMAATTAPLIAMINNDVILHPNWLESSTATLALHPHAGSIATRILQMKDTSRLDSAGFDLRTCGATQCWCDKPAETFHNTNHHPFGAVASAALYRRTALHASGWFHPEFFAYYDDTDLAIRLRLVGYSCIYDHNAVSRHYGSATGRRHSAFHRYHLRRNIELMFWTAFPPPSARRLLPTHLAYETACAIIMATQGQLATFFKAKRDALRMTRWMRHTRHSFFKQVATITGRNNRQTAQFFNSLLIPTFIPPRASTQTR